MKKLFTILVSVTLLLPLYAQETETEPEESSLENVNRDGFLTEGEILVEGEEYEIEDEGENEIQAEESPKSKSMTRQHFAFGLLSDIQVGFDNSLIGIGEIFKKNIVVDLNNVYKYISDDGVNLNVAAGVDLLFVDILNIAIKEGLWDFGFFINTEGNINFNIPQNLFDLITQGNINEYTFEGMISASGGVYAGAGVNASASYGKLRAGIKPTLFTPLIFIPESGIKYHLDTDETVDLTSSGEIIVYSPLDKNNNFTDLKFGFDVSLESEYALFPFLDIGASFYNIPLAPATLQNRMRIGMSELELHLDGLDALKNGTDDLPDLGKFDDPIYDSVPYKVYRPFRFDVYAQYKPFDTEILVVKPNIGFSVDVNEEKGYFNAGLEIQSTLNEDMIKLHLGTGYQEAIWKHRLGFAFNFRFFELGLEGALRADSFVGTFQGHGFAIGIHSRFGW